MTDLTSKPIFRTISLFALPMLLGNLLQQLYNVVDSWIVGKFISADALAAVGAVFALTVFLNSVLIGLCMGSGVVFSLDFGRGDTRALQRRIGTAFVAIAAITLAVFLASRIWLNGLLRWMNIPAEVYGLTASYLRVILLGIPAVYLYNFFSAYLESLGNSVVPLVFLAVSAVLNILLDFLFIVFWNRGVAGAAYATVLAQYVSAVGLALYVLGKDQCARQAFSHLELRLEDVNILMKYSLFTCLQQSVMNFGILMVQGIVNSFGTAVMAAFTSGTKIDAFAYMPAQEYGNAFSTFVAQNYSAGRADRVRAGIRCAILTAGGYALAASAVLWIWAKPLIEIFVRAEETEIVRIGVQYLHIEGVFYVGIACLFLLYGIFRAVGKPEMSLVLTVISLGTRVLLAKLSAATAIGVLGIWWAIPIGWFLADAVGLARLRSVSRKQEEK